MTVDIRFARSESERDTLLGFLDFYRKELIDKSIGISDEQARMTSVPPSDLTLMGLIRHMAEVERHWFRRILVGEEVASLWCGDSHPTGDSDGDFHVTSADALHVSIAHLRAEIAIADVNLARFTLDDMAARGGSRPGTGVPNVRWIVVHMIEEYARHCGHADLIRECIDGAKGD
ncbi:MAG: DinB family protein [Ilumatobacteraceae bacterium]